MPTDVFPAAWAYILQWEGSTYTNNPADPGGPTRWGVTLATLAAYRKRPTAASDVQNLTADEAQAVYRLNYWTPLGCAQMASPGVAIAIFGLAVNIGCGAAAKMAQAAVGAVADGAVGPKSMAAINAADPEELLEAVSIAAQRYYRAIVDRRPDQAVFEKGWLNRAVGLQLLRHR